MRTIDFTPVFRSTVGFDRMARLMDAAMRSSEANAGTHAYPPYNIEKLSEDEYRITMAVAGFSEADLDIQVENGTLVITGKQENRKLAKRQHSFTGGLQLAPSSAGSTLPTTSR